MNILVITPGYISHYRPIDCFLKESNIMTADIAIATSSELRDIVERDGYHYTEFYAWENSNPGKIDMDRQRECERDILQQSYEATKNGMISALRFQAEHRIHDLFGRVEDIVQAIEEINNLYHPKVFVVVQLCYNVVAALERLQYRYITFVTGHPDQLPRQNEVYGYPYNQPKMIRCNNDELTQLYQVCSEVQNEASRQYEAIVGKKTNNVFSIASKEMVIYNYPKELLSHRNHLPNEYYLGAACRKCEINEGLEERLKAIHTQNTPIIYVSFGTVFSVRGDALKKIFIALAGINCHVVVAKGVLGSEYETYIKDEWTALEFAPQMLVLKYSNLLIGHGGNNSIIEALYYGVPVISCPFASDQFFSAASIEENQIGTVIDPNYSTIDEIREAIYVALDCRSNAKKIQQYIMITKNERRAQQRLIQIISED